MAGKFTVHQLVTKMLGDVTFRAAVIKDPRQGPQGDQSQTNGGAGRGPQSDRLE